MAYNIQSKEHYHETMEKIYEMMNKRQQALSPEDLILLTNMTKAAEKYEDEILKIGTLH